MFSADKWTDYQLIDANNGEKLERWGKYLLVRPDPQIVWKLEKDQMSPLWNKADAKYIRSKTGGGHWETYRRLPELWEISYGNLTFGIKPMGFKHTGLFPEQAANWDWTAERILQSGRKDVKVLNLFAYTGGATVAAAQAGASVCHVDAAKGMVTWAKENAYLSGLRDHPIRYIVDDVKKFAMREMRRGNRYDGIIMDPPSYGRGPGGELWKLEQELFDLLALCTGLLTEKPLFFLVNTYTTGLSGGIMETVMHLTLQQKFGGRVQVDEVGLPIENLKMHLPCGYSTRWQPL